ncbi:MAG: hypothetical protein RSD49_06545 [Hafnia sp.]
MSDKQPDAVLRPSATLQADPYWTGFWKAGVISLEEAERRADGAVRLKAVYGTDPWYANKALKDPSFWSRFYGSRINW